MDRKDVEKYLHDNIGRYISASFDVGERCNIEKQENSWEDLWNMISKIVDNASTFYTYDDIDRELDVWFAKDQRLISHGIVCTSQVEKDCYNKVHKFFGWI